MDAAIWNLLHDGAIESIEGDVPGHIGLSVGIAYLREMFDPAGDAFRLRLLDCTLFELRSWTDGAVIRDRNAIMNIEPEILSAEAFEEYIVVLCTGSYRIRIASPLRRS